MLVRRIIHPVGFGAFCTEQFWSRDRNVVLNVVYDCGSMSLDTESLQQEIENTEGLDRGIDLLFISHFHDDHINGIRNILLKEEQTYIRYGKTHVILPLLSQHYIYEKLRTDPGYLTNYIDFIMGSIADGEHEARYSLSLVNITGEALSEEVRSITIGEEGITSDLSSKLSGKIAVRSGRHRVNIWEYIPFNFVSKAEEKQFEDEANAKLSHKLSKILDGDLSVEDVDTLKEIYKSIKEIQHGSKKTDLNKQSTLLLSRAAHDGLPFVRGWDCYDCYRHGYCCACHNLSCLYTGDSCLTGWVLGALSRILRSSGVRQCYPLGLLQIPHHGSRNNLNVNLISMGIAREVFINNVRQRMAPKHPQISGSIINACRECGVPVRIVSEDKKSQLDMVTDIHWDY